MTAPVPVPPPAQPPTPPTPPPGAARAGRSVVVRRWIAMAMVVITTLLVVASSVAVWAYRTVLDTDQFMDAVGPALNDPVFYDVLADNVTEQTLLALDLDTRVSERLTELDEVLAAALIERLEIEPGPLAEALAARIDRPTLASLTPVVVDRLETRVETVVHRLITSEAFRDRLPQLVERAHSAAIGIARADLEDYPNVYLTDDAVMLNTIPLVAEALQAALGSVGDMLPGVTVPDVVADNAPQARERLGEALGTRLPEEFGQVEIMDRATFTVVQETVRTVDRAVWLLVIVTVLMIVATVMVAPDRRRGTIQLALGILVGIVISAALIARLRGTVVDVARTPDGERAARVLYDAVTQGTQSIFWLVGIVAAVAAVGGLLLGRGAWVEQAADRWPWVRTATGEDGRMPHWVAAHADALRIAVVAVGVLVVVATGFHWVALVAVALFLLVTLTGISVAQRTADVPGDRA